MLVEHLFDLPRIYVEAAADDHLLLPVDDEEVAVFVHATQVSGLEPASRVDRLRRGLGELPVPLHDVVASDGDLTDLALRRLGAVVGDDPPRRETRDPRRAERLRAASEARGGG